MTRTYTAEQRVEAVALAASVGPVEAARRLGYPRRTVASWTHTPAASPIIAAAEDAIAARLRTAHAEAMEAVLAGIRDPKSRLLDRARALEVLGGQLALAEGRATSNVHALNVTASADLTTHLSDEERTALRHMLDAALAGQGLAELASGQLPDRATLGAMIGTLERQISEREP
jgi:hypothetical protein